MSIASEISRLQSAKANLKTAINAKTDAQHQITTETLDDYSDFVDSIQTGGDTTDLKNLIQRTGTTITIPNDITSIGNAAFNRYTSLNSITLPNTITSIGDYAFQYCSGLTSFTIPSGINTLARGVLGSCSNLTTLTIPYNITTIGSDSLSGLVKMEEFIYNANMSGNFTASQYPLQHMGRDTTSGCDFKTGSNVTHIPAYLCYYGSYNQAKIKDVIIGDNVTSIGVGAFGNGSIQGTTLTIGTGVTTLGNECFSYSSNITTLNYNATNVSSFSNINTIFAQLGASGNGVTVNIGNNVTSLPYSMFYISLTGRSPKIITVNIGNGITNIGGQAFKNCSTLTTINITATTPPTLGSDAFTGCSALTTINVPSASLTAYQTATNWSAYSSYMVGV